METVIKIRPAKLLLSWQHDPKKVYTHMTDEHLEEACGIIPDFFERALSVDEFAGIETLAGVMDDLYGFGGFEQYPLNGEVTAGGTYISEYNDDEDLEPLIAFASLDPARCDVEMFVYPYGIVGLRDSAGATKIARFD